MLASPNVVALVRAIHELPNKSDVVVYVYHGSSTDIYFSVSHLLYTHWNMSNLNWL